MQIVPALLATTPASLSEQFARVGALTNLVHYDVADGRFVATKTPAPSSYPQPNSGQRIVWHLMAHEPAVFVADCLRLPTEAIILHAEANGIAEALEELAVHDVQVGLALNPATAVQSVVQSLVRVQLVQVMTVEPGKQGQPFLPESLPKLAELQSYGVHRLAVDGGVNHGTIKQVVRYQPDYIFVGSALTSAPHPAMAFKLFNESISGGDGDDTGA